MPQILSTPISLKGNYKRFASTYGSLNFMVRLVTEEIREKTREMQLRNAISKCLILCLFCDFHFNCLKPKQYGKEV